MELARRVDQAATYWHAAPAGGAGAGGVTAADSGVDLRSGRSQLSAPDAATFSRGPRVRSEQSRGLELALLIQGDPHVSPVPAQPAGLSASVHCGQDLPDAGIGQSRPIREYDGRYDVVAAVDTADELGRRWVVLDVDLLEVQACALHLRLQPDAVAAPGC